MSRDVRFALRSLRGAPLVSMLAIACIGLGIGAVTTVYSSANAFTFGVRARAGTHRLHG